MQIPKNPDEFFSDYLPRSFAPLREKLGATSSAGAVVFRIGSRAPLAIRIVNGALDCQQAIPDDSIVQLSLAEADFEPVLIRGAELLLENDAAGDRQLAVLKALTLEPERIAVIRAVQGSVAFVLTDGQREHRVTLTPGNTAPNLDAVECTVRAALGDFLAMQRGSANPFELLMNGKIQISGDAQIPMALSSLLI